ncbi:hypothetical protein [Enterovibrio norvegicus]
MSPQYTTRWDYVPVVRC